MWRMFNVSVRISILLLLIEIFSICLLGSTVYSIVEVLCSLTDWINLFVIKSRVLKSAIAFHYFPVAINNFQTMHIPPRLSFYWVTLLWHIQFSLPQLPMLLPLNL